MPLTEAQRRANRKYNAAHYTNISVRVSFKEAEAIRAACALLNTTASTICRRALLDTVSQAAALDRNEQGSGSDNPIHEEM